ncbi:MAG: tRNA (adenine-N1)-methyltransferase [Bacillota bacterium]|nr:tRNA (adenine-N1)-methyltransferase [Bacillota bacterium]
MSPFAYGDLVLLLDGKGRRVLLQLAEDQVSQVPSGHHLPHQEVVGKDPGSWVKPVGGRPLLALHPSLEDYVMAMERPTQIIYPKDMGQLLVYGDVRPGTTILEAGVGSGATALLFLRVLGPQGKLISVERRADFLRAARDNVVTFWGGFPASWDLRHGDIYEGLPGCPPLDLMFLDLPEPQRALPVAADALKPGGLLLIWVPTIYQVEKVLAQTRQNTFSPPDIKEFWERDWITGPQSLRPDHRMVGHTGFLLRFRRHHGKGDGLYGPLDPPL